MKVQKEGEPLIVMDRLTYLQVCVPKAWTNEQITKWVNIEYPTGITSQWEPLGPEHAKENGYTEHAQCDHHASHHHLLVGC